MAEAPLFGLADQCVQVVDKQAQGSVHVSYTVASDDTALMPGDIAVPDAKTHQFFAFSGALFAHELTQELFAFTPGAVHGTLLPSWITTSDVKRAAQATNTLDGTAFSEADIPEGAVLDANAALHGTYRRVTADDARVPITLEQSLAGVDWPLAEVEPGLYTFAGYVFSPPYNGWSPRAQLIEIVDGADARPGPALGVEPVEGALFAYQGRRVRACVSVPEGSQLKASFTVIERPESGEIEWLPSTPIASGMLDLCFRDPRPELSGSLRLRFEVSAPDGTTRSFYSPDTVTALPGTGRCSESETICCPAGSEAPSEPPCSGNEADDCAAPDAQVGRGEQGDAGATDDDPTDSGRGSTGEDASDDDARAVRPSSAGCALALHASGARRPGLLAWIGLWLTFAAVRLTRARHHRKTAGTA